MIVKLNNTTGLYDTNSVGKPFMVNGINLGHIEKIDRGVIYVSLYTDCDLELDFCNIMFSPRKER